MGAILPQLGLFTEHSVVKDCYRCPLGLFSHSPSPHSWLGSGLCRFRGPEGPLRPWGVKVCLQIIIRTPDTSRYIKEYLLIIVKYKLLYELNTIYIANKNTLNISNNFSLCWAAASRPESCGEWGVGMVKVCTKYYYLNVKEFLVKL